MRWRMAVTAASLLRVVGDMSLLYDHPSIFASAKLQKLELGVLDRSPGSTMLASHVTHPCVADIAFPHVWVLILPVQGFASGVPANKSHDHLD